MIGLVLDHLWQSTLFAAAAGGLTLFLTSNSAGVRYGLWLAASLKFLLPLALLTAAAGAVSRALSSPPPALNVIKSVPPAPRLIQALGDATQPFSGSASFTIPAPVDWTPLLAAAWLVGLVFVCGLWLRR